MVNRIAISNWKTHLNINKRFVVMNVKSYKVFSGRQPKVHPDEILLRYWVGGIGIL